MHIIEDRHTANIHLRNADAFLDDVGESMSIVIGQSMHIHTSARRCNLGSQVSAFCESTYSGASRLAFRHRHDFVCKQPNHAVT